MANASMVITISLLLDSWTIYAGPRRSSRVPLTFEVSALANLHLPSFQKSFGSHAYHTSGQRCEFGDNCCMGHVCPHGMKCPFLKQGNCKYTRRTSVHLPSHHSESFSDTGDTHKSGYAHRDSEETSWKAQSTKSKRRRIFGDSAVGIWDQP